MLQRMIRGSCHHHSLQLRMPGGAPEGIAAQGCEVAVACYRLHQLLLQRVGALVPLHRQILARLHSPENTSRHGSMGTTRASGSRGRLLHSCTG